MSAFRCCLRRSLALLAALLGELGPAHAATQAELTGVLATGELLTPPSSARSGREQRARFELWRREPGRLQGIATSARLGLELRLDGLGNDAPTLRDASSWLRVDMASSQALVLSLRAFPFDTDYERLGHLHALSWGGSDVSRGESSFVAQSGGAPGLELGLHAARVELDAGLRWAKTGSELGTSRRLWAGLVRAAFRPWPALRVDLGLGYFQRAALDAAPTATPVFVEGASLRLSWLAGLAEPELSPEPFRPATPADDSLLLGAPERLGAALSLEAVLLASQRRLFEAPAVTTLQPAPALALYGSWRGAVLAMHAVASWRSLAFVERNGSGLMRGETPPRSALAQAEQALWAGLSFTAPFGLTPSVLASVSLPAALETPASLPGYSQTFVVRDRDQATALPVGSARLPIVAGRVALRFQASASLALALFADYERDPNRVQWQGQGATARRAFATPDRLSCGLAVKARF